MWFRLVQAFRVRIRDLGAIVRDAGHTEASRLNRINAALVSVGLPPPPFFI